MNDDDIVEVPPPHPLGDPLLLVTRLHAFELHVHSLQRAKAKFAMQNCEVINCYIEYVPVAFPTVHPCNSLAAPFYTEHRLM